MSDFQTRPEIAASENGGAALTALGSDVRRHIVQLVAEAPHSTGQIAEQFSISRPAISRHLKLLSDAGLIERQTRGTQSIYRLKQQGFIASREWLNQFWPESLHNLKTVAENTYREQNDA